MKYDNNKKLDQSFKPIAKKLSQKWEIRKKYLKKKEKPITKPKYKPSEEE